MKKIKFHFRNTINVVITIATLIIGSAILYYYIFDSGGFEKVFDYVLGIVAFALIIVGVNVALVVESIKDWKKK